MLINSPNISGSLTVTGNSVITGSLTVLGGINGAITGSAATASYVEYSNVANKPTLVSGSSQVTYSGLTGIPSGIVSGSSQVTYSGLTGIPSGIVSGSAQIAAFGYATTGSNTFQANQTITGSLFITQNLIVAGSSSIQYISSSVLDIADNIITVNAFNPGVRFGGLAVIDSGSSPQVSGSLLFDSIKDQWIFVHQNQSVVTSSVLLMGPKVYDNIGNETYLSANRLPKGTGIEHLNDSNITDTGTLVSINSNTQVTGSLNATGTVTAPTFSGALSGNASTSTSASFASTSPYSGLQGTVPTWNQNTTGNAATATVLQTARTIGGVSFNGSANIDLPGVNTSGNQNTSGNAATATSAATWTTGRTLTIGSTGKSVDGSANVAWSLAEIGAQAALTNPVTGTGTSGQVAYFTGTSAISSESNLFWDATNNRLGINQSSPLAPLHVGSESSSDDANVQRWDYAGSSAYQLILKQTVTSGVVRWNFSQINNSTAYNNVLVLDRGNVGMGLTSPQAILDVSHTAGTTNIIRVSNGSGNYRWRVDQTFSMVMTNASNVDTFSVNTSGDVQTVTGFQGRYSRIYETGAQRGGFYPYNVISGGGADYSIGLFSESELFFLTGGGVTKRMLITTGGAMGLGVTPTNTAGRFEASNDIVAYSSSDIRFKNNISVIENSLDKISKIRGVYFDWVEMEEFHGNKGHDVGVIAQEIEAILPEIVTTRDSGYKAVKYEKLVPLLIEAIKELSKEVEILKGK